MQTFLPYPDFIETAKCLDNKRLGKQRVEAMTLVKAITEGNGWSNHPTAKMWKGYENALQLYFNFIVYEWTDRGYLNTLPLFDRDNTTLKFPCWFGNEAFHSSHRAALLAKDYKWYSQFGWREEPQIDYVWPV